MYDLGKQIDDLALAKENEVVKDVKALIASVITILNDHSTSETVKLADGSTVNKRAVSRQKLRAILRDLRKLESQTSDIIYDGTVSAIEAGIIATTAYLVGQFKSITKDGKSTAKTYIDKPRKEDGLTLRDRADMQATSYTNDLITRIRVSINKGEALPETLDEVADVFDGKEWQLRRIVTTEVFDSYRKKIGEIADENGKEWIKIHESFPRHPRRLKHTC